MNKNLISTTSPARRISRQVATLLFVTLCATLPLPAADPDAKHLNEALADTRWLWHGREDRILILRKDGTFDLKDWTRQGIAATWKATAPQKVTVTVTSAKFKNLTATLIFEDKLGAFTGTDLDKNRAITRSPRIDEVEKPLPGDLKDLTRRLGGTKWLWHGRKDQVVELRKDGAFQLDAWQQQGIEARWQVSGKREAGSHRVSHQ